VKAFHRFEDYPSSGCNKSGSPGCVFGVVATTGYKALPKGVVVSVKVLLCNYRVRWEIAEMVSGPMESTTDSVVACRQSCSRCGGYAG
jgi:hypothetical protein